MSVAGAWRTLLMLLVATLPGCWPAYRVELPELEIHVQDGQGRPLSAEFVLLSASEPHSQVWRRVQGKTDSEGKAVVALQRAWRFEGLSTHGSRKYYLAWCMEAEGFAPKAGMLSEMPSSAGLEISMQPGSGRCPGDDITLLAMVH